MNFTDTQPALTRQPIHGPQFGMPYQGGLYGLTMNFSMAEAKGIPMPSPGSWGLETDFIETAKQASDLETGEWGHWMHAHPALMWGAWSFGLSDNGTRMYRNPEGTHFEAFEDGGDRGYRLAIGTIYDHGVAFPPQDSKQYAGEFGNPYSAGKVLYGFHGGGPRRNGHAGRRPIPVGAHPEPGRTSRNNPALVQQSTAHGFQFGGD